MTVFLIILALVGWVLFFISNSVVKDLARILQTEIDIHKRYAQEARGEISTLENEIEKLKSENQELRRVTENASL